VTVLVVGSVALDSVETPFGSAENVLGGSATFFASAASLLTTVQVVGVVGSDYPVDKLAPLVARGVDFAGLERAEGESFRWRGRYRHDLNTAETLETRLGVFSHFRPNIPEQFRKAPFVFLGNIDPRLQIDVLSQVDAPKLVACDTMNFWIESRRADLIALLRQVHLITLNDAEARQLTERANLVHAARWILDQGPRYVIIKKGEHGAFMFTRESIFYAPAYPLETGDLSDANMRRAVVYGAAMGSFAVEKFSNERLLELTRADVDARVAEFRKLVAFDTEMPT
jgi:sugar/nucleoside kinase (ribokinase family)